MRVIWISVGLLAVFLVALFAFYDPQQDPAQSASVNTPVVDNPFVEEKTVETTAGKEVELAVLPADHVDPPKTNNASAELTETTALVSTEVVTNTAAPAQENSISEGKPSVENEAVAVASEESNSIVVEKPGEVKKDEKKLGLAMIVLEKEQKKNKIAVIVHETNPQKLTEKEIKALYLDRLTRWQDGSRVMLYDLPLGDKYRDKFSRSVLKMTALEADKQESKRRELRIKANDVEVKAKNVVVSYVEQNPNAVAYVPLNLVRDKSNVKIVLTIP
ncbi:hypothetical protein [Kaarinaea lacus]